MTASDPTPDRPTRDLHTTLSALLIALALGLLAFMITVESEPGALPLLLLVVGLGWHVAARRVNARR